jgi:ubiquitin C-terminal hydrolase
VQAAPKSYFEGFKKISIQSPIVENSFVLDDGKEERVITCQCYNQISTTPGVLKLDVYRHMTESEAFEVGWGVGEVIKGGATVWYCPKCMEDKSCKHIWQIMIKGDKMQLTLPGSEMIRTLIKENAINLYGVVQFTFRMCSKCDVWERMKE